MKRITLVSNGELFVEVPNVFQEQKEYQKKNPPINSQHTKPKKKK